MTSHGLFCLPNEMSYLESQAPKLLIGSTQEDGNSVSRDSPRQENCFFGNENLLRNISQIRIVRSPLRNPKQSRVFRRKGICVEFKTGGQVNFKFTCPVENDRGL